MKKRMRFVLIAAVVMLFSAVATAVALPSIPSSKFADAEGCTCHGTFQAQWSKSMHSQAITDPIYIMKRDEGNKATNGTVGEFCDTCHAPVAIMGGEDPEKPDSMSSVSKQGISCDFCHQVTGTTTPLANTALSVAGDGIKRAQLTDPQAPHAAQFNPTFQKAEFCGSCHNVNHPSNGLPLEATYTEWKNGPYAKEGTQCQDCHMTPGAGVTKPNPGSVATGAPEREMIYEMTFVGGNVGLGDADLATERLQHAAKLAVKTPDIVPKGEETSVTVTVTNSGAGHYLPTGLTETRQMWLVVKGIDENGKATQLLRRDFGTVLEDANGKAPAELWDAVKIKSDDRIPPKQSVTEETKFTMPSDTAKVTATLYYRSCSPEMAKAAKVTIPTTTMASTTAELYANQEAKAAALKKASDEAKNDSAQQGATSPWVYIITSLIGVIILIVVITLVVRNYNKKADAADRAGENSSQDAPGSDGNDEGPDSGQDA